MTTESVNEALPHIEEVSDLAENNIDLCPFCGGLGSQCEEIELGIFAVCCDVCGCHGPIEGDAETARKKWNNNAYFSQESV